MGALGGQEQGQVGYHSLSHAIRSVGQSVGQVTDCQSGNWSLINKYSFKACRLKRMPPSKNNGKSNYGNTHYKLILSNPSNSTRDIFNKIDGGFFPTRNENKGQKK